MARLKVGDSRRARFDILKAGIVKGDTLTVTAIRGTDHDHNPHYDVKVQGKGKGVLGKNESLITHRELTGKTDGAVYDS